MKRILLLLLGVSSVVVLAQVPSPPSGLVVVGTTANTGLCALPPCYDIPMVPGDISTYRRTTWYPAGLDMVGGIPSITWPNNTCVGVTQAGTGAANTTALNNCVTAAASQTCVFIPAGTYVVSGQINMKSNVCIRGAAASSGPPWMPSVNAAMTRINLQATGRINFDGGSKATSFTPAAPNGTSITAGYTPGSTSVTVTSAASYAVGDTIVIYQNRDTQLVEGGGTECPGSNCDYFGEDCGSTCADVHAFSMLSTITAKSGNTVTFTPPIYATSSALTPVSFIRKITFTVSLAGLENMVIYNSTASSNFQPIFLRFTKNCWIKAVETYNLGGDNGSGSPHVWTVFSYGNTYTGMYVHTGISHFSGRNYGLEFYNWNARHLVENNIVRDTRHSIALEGGGAGFAILNNYTDDNYEDNDLTFLSEDLLVNHGAHPLMNLVEGNKSSNITADYTGGSSSHGVWFRNFANTLRTGYSNTGLWAQYGLDIQQYNRYYAMVGNMSGYAAQTTGTIVCNSACGSSPLAFMFRFGWQVYNSYADTLAFSTALFYGNCNYVTHTTGSHPSCVPQNAETGFATGWGSNGASALKTLKSSLYYPTKPPYFGTTCPWPAFGPDLPQATLDGGTMTNPAYVRYNGGTCN